ncbi:MAG: hypothetical protein NVS9B4_25330 [Candidatus Acidiferrum sp.]
MGFLNKLGISMGAATARELPRRTHSGSKLQPPGAAVAVDSSRSPNSPESARVSNGLKELLWNLDGLGRGTLLDLGPAWQTTLSFFIERGFRVSSEDLLRGWKEFVDQEDKALRDDNALRESWDMSANGRALRFLEFNLQYPPGSFDAILLWDLLDYLDPTLGKHMVGTLTDLLRPGGIVFAMFHTKKPETFQRYRIADSNTLQLISVPMITPAQKAYQNREIQDLFSRYRSMKSFVGRDQLRETLFVK